MRGVFIALLLCVSMPCFGQLIEWESAGLSQQQPPASGGIVFNPATVLDFYWSYRDIPTNFVAVTNWVDEVQSTNLGAFRLPPDVNAITNTPQGVYLSGGGVISMFCVLTNTPFTVPSGFTYWIVLGSNTPSLTEAVGGDPSYTTGIFSINSGTYTYFSGGYQTQSGTLVQGNTYDLYYVNGASWVNNTFSASNTTSSMIFSEFGNDNFSSEYIGYVKFIGIKRGIVSDANRQLLYNYGQTH